MKSLALASLTGMSMEKERASRRYMTMATSTVPTSENGRSAGFMASSAALVSASNPT